MHQTANYNLNLPEGTDVVNPLVDYNPNFSTIDSAMKANADRTVGRATCIKTGTTHVVTRSNTGSNIINFTATGDWNEGDTMSIDSTIVSVFLPDGSAALDGAYLINSEVFGILNGTRFTLYSNITELTASATSYNNTASELSASNVQDAIDEVNSKVDGITIPKLYAKRESFAGSSQSVNVIYTAAGFTQPPTVVCQLEGGRAYTRAEIGDSPIYVSNITKNGCTVEINRIANNNAVAFYYIAYGV